MPLVNQQLIKEQNLKQIYLSVYTNRGISRSALAKQFNLSKTTVSSLTDELIEKKFLVDSGTGDSGSVGRKPNCLNVRTGSYYVIVANWVEDTVRFCVIDIAGTSVYDETCMLENGADYVSVMQECFCHSVLRRFGESSILGICVTVSAMIDTVHEEIYSTTLSLPAGENVNLIRRLQGAFPGYQIALLEDTACYAYAEKVYTAISEKNFAFINFGRGIGATLFVEGQMLGKANGAFTQFGHYSINPKGPLCVCGNHGCLESYLSEGSMKRRLTEEKAVPSLSSGRTVTFSNLGKAALYGDVDAQGFLAEMADELAMALSNLICIANPSLIVLGGKCPDLGAFFLEELRKALPGHGFRRMVDYTTIRYSRLEPDSFFNGAMKYFFDSYYFFTEAREGALYLG